MTFGNLPSPQLEEAFVRAIRRFLPNTPDRSERLAIATAVREEIELVLRTAPYGKSPGDELIVRVTLGATLDAAMARVLSEELADLPVSDRGS
jgi:hypothetical protein